MRRLSFLMILLVGTVLVSCQNTNITDLINYSRLSEKKAAALEKDVTIAFDRTAVLVDSTDRTGDDVKVRKGSTVKVLGYKYRVGGQKAFPPIFRENYTSAVDPWLVLLPDGRRAYMEVPEMAIGVPGKDGVSVTAVKDQSGSALFLYKTTAEDSWTDDPGIKYDKYKDVAVYFPKRHFVPFAELTGLESVVEKKWWQEAAYALRGPIDFFSEHTLNILLYPSGRFYSYHPLFRTTPFWAKVIQAILSFILLLAVFMATVPWLASRSVMYIPAIPNWLVIVLARILAIIYFIIIATFLGVYEYGFIGWILMYFLGIRSNVTDEVESNRCPYCNKVGLEYEGSTDGDWGTSRSSHERKEEKSRSEREYDTCNGLGKEHHKEIIHNMGIKKYTDITHSRVNSMHYVCPHCGAKVDIDWTESHTESHSEWKS